VFPCFVHREGLRHVVEVLPEIPYEPTGDRKGDITALTAIINDTISKAIRERPEEWLWLHDRWRSAPPEQAQPEGEQQ
jgi:KDO2-lipid IV(A) lauroyltransferase